MYCLGICADETRRNSKMLNQSNRSLGTDMNPGLSEKNRTAATQERRAVQRTFIKLRTLGKEIYKLVVNLMFGIPMFYLY